MKFAKCLNLVMLLLSAIVLLLGFFTDTVSEKEMIFFGVIFLMNYIDIKMEG